MELDGRVRASLPEPYVKGGRLDRDVKVWMAPRILHYSGMPSYSTNRSKYVDSCLNKLFERFPDLAPTHDRRNLKGADLDSYKKVRHSSCIVGS